LKAVRYWSTRAISASCASGAEGNQFTLVLREISDRDDVETRLQAIAEHGVPTILAPSASVSAAVTCWGAALGRERRAGARSQ
jgi:hypothetical protein